MTRTAIAKADSYDMDVVRKAIWKIADNTAFPSVSGKTVLVKPNILSDSYPVIQ